MMFKKIVQKVILWKWHQVNKESKFYDISFKNMCLVCCENVFGNGIRHEMM